ncbi:MAG TPA: ice-binding family protein [Acidimicrobiia bacterium]|nr:ice-binding family protein [Acidimicrobiia bacterium]
MFLTILIIGLVAWVGLVGLHWRGSPRLRSASQGGKWLKPARGMGVALLAVTTGASLFLAMGTAQALIVPTIDLGTSADFSVLGGTTVTNSGDSVLAGSVGVSPGTAITGFPPGIAATIQAGTPEAANAQAASLAAYLDALNRPLNQTVTSDLTGLTLVGGVYAGPDKSPLSLPGTLTLDGEGNPNSVFIFQTNSTLITGPGSTVSLINGAQACNVFWQVGSSATLDTGSTFVGNILALTSISVADSVTVQGRALAQNGAVTLLNDTFTQVGCDLTLATTTTTSTTTTTVTDATATTTTEAGAGTAATTTPTSLPFTGQNSIGILVAAMVALALGIGVLRMSHGVATEQD